MKYLRVLPDVWMVVNGINVGIYHACTLADYVTIKLFIPCQMTTHRRHWREQPHALLDTVLEVGQFL